MANHEVQGCNRTVYTKDYSPTTSSANPIYNLAVLSSTVMEGAGCTKGDQRGGGGDARLSEVE